MDESSLFCESRNWFFCRPHSPSHKSFQRQEPQHLRPFAQDGERSKQNRRRPQTLANVNRQLPLGLLNAAQGHPMLVELKNGETLNGHLVQCDTWMNLTLKEVVQTSPVRL